MSRLLPALMLSTALLAAPAIATKPPPATGQQAHSGLPFAQPRPGLFTAGQPNAGALAQAAAAGITTVIDLRAADEDRGYDQAAAAAGLGLRYVNLPIAGGQAVTVEAARQLHALLADSEGPVLLHCASGNRAGALLALAAAHVDGADPDSALALGQAAGLTSLAQRVQTLLPAAADGNTAHAPAAAADQPR